MQNPSWRALQIVLVGLLVVCSLAPAEPRPYVFGCGRFIGLWSGKPRSYDEQCWDHMQNIGVTFTGAGLAWVDAEPTRGNYNWDAIDYADFEVDGALAHGMQVGFFLGLTPQWAALRPDLPPHRTPPSEEYVDEFMEFHRWVAERYKGRVKYYYFWNEPNGCSWINDGCSNADGYPLYTKWLIRCSQAVKSVDPDAKIIAGRLDYHSGVTSGVQYIQGMYDHGAGPHIDGICIHPYGNPLHWQALRDTRQVMVANGDAHKPVWITEYGWNSGTEEQRAANLQTVLTELQKPEYDYVQMAHYLVLNDGAGVEGYGMMDANLNPRLRYYTFRDFPKDIPTATATPTGPTPTPSDTPTRTQTPTATPTLPAGVLRNGDFEEGFALAPSEFQDDPAYMRYKAAGWSLWGHNWWKDSGPEGQTYHSPTGCQSVGTNWGQLDNAVYQQVGAQPGVRYRLSAWVRLEASVSSGALSSAVGLDPAGGTDPEGTSVVYGPETQVEDAWQQVSVEVQAQGAGMTLFVRGRTETVGGWQWFHVDDVTLEALDGPTPQPTDTGVPPTDTPLPEPTDTVPPPTDTAVPAPTDTPTQGAGGTDATLGLR